LHPGACLPKFNSNKRRSRKASRSAFRDNAIAARSGSTKSSPLNTSTDKLKLQALKDMKKDSNNL
jgi:hypothetical protein